MILKKLARGILVMLSLFLLENAHLAESESVTVKVTESKGEPVPSATAKSKKISTTTAPEGSFRISEPTGASILVCSSVDFGSQKLSISSKDGVSVLSVSFFYYLNIYYFS